MAVSPQGGHPLPGLCPSRYVAPSSATCGVVGGSAGRAWSLVWVTWARVCAPLASPLRSQCRVRSADRAWCLPWSLSWGWPSARRAATPFPVCAPPAPPHRPPYWVGSAGRPGPCSGHVGRGGWCQGCGCGTDVWGWSKMGGRAFTVAIGRFYEILAALVLFLTETFG